MEMAEEIVGLGRGAGGAVLDFTSLCDFTGCHF